MKMCGLSGCEEATNARHALCMRGGMTSTLKTLLLSALAVTSMGFTNNSASAQCFQLQSLSAARRTCIPAPVPVPRYIPGHYKTIRERVRVPGATYRVYVEGRYRSRCRGIFGRCVSRYRPGRYELRQEPDRYEYRTRKVWVPGRYSY